MSRYIDTEFLDDIVDELNRNGYDISNTTLLRGKIILSHIPTADAVEVVHGEWVFNQFGEPHCSVCGNYPLQNGDESYALSNYCPHCGAKMDKGVKL